MRCPLNRSKSSFLLDVLGDSTGFAIVRPSKSSRTVLWQECESVSHVGGDCGALHVRLADGKAVQLLNAAEGGGKLAVLADLLEARISTVRDGSA